MNNQLPPLQFGRPCKQPWHNLKHELQTLIDKGYGLGRIAKCYGMTPNGIKVVLEKHGLKTRYQEREHIAREAK